MRTDTKICQNSGVSLAIPERFGKNRNGSPHTDYRCSCFRNGSFTGDLILTEETKHFTCFLNKPEKVDVRTLAGKNLTLRMRGQFPTLKRWQSYEITRQKYSKAISTAIHFINEHLHEAINLRDLAEAVHISGFHFHRIFKAMLGKCPGRYIQQLRMEKAASELKATGRTLVEIAEQTGYQSPQALSKAFRKYYGIAPSEFRKHLQDAGIPA